MFKIEDVVKVIGEFEGVFEDFLLMIMNILFDNSTIIEGVVESSIDGRSKGSGGGCCGDGRSSFGESIVVVVVAVHGRIEWNGR